MVASSLLLLVEPDTVQARAIIHALHRLHYEAVRVNNLDSSTLDVDHQVLCILLSLLGQPEERLEEFSRWRAGHTPPLPPILALLPGASTSFNELSSIEIDDVLPWPASDLVLMKRLKVLSRLRKKAIEIESFTGILARMVTALENREPHRFEHAIRVASLSGRMAQVLGFSNLETERLRQGALLHDIGTVAIPDQILFKREPLTNAEFALVRSHPVIGYDMIKDLPSLEPVGPFILRHHERINGTGYPDGLSKSELPLPVQVLSLADAYEAMTSSRPYRTVRPHGTTLDVLRDEARCGIWDPSLVEILGTAAAEGAGITIRPD